MYEQLRAEIRAALEETGTPGCALGLTHKAQTLLEGFGLANAEARSPFTPDTRMPIGSMTKPYTATAVVSLAERGRIDLDAPVRQYLPEFSVADDQATAQATVRQLLNHTSGWVGDLENQDSDDPERIDRGDQAIASQVARMRRYAQVTPPGALWSYSNSGYVVAGRLLEVICGEQFEEAIRRRIFAPLGMTQTTMFPELAITHPLAVGHVARESGFDVVHALWAPPRRGAPAGGIISTATDQLRWLRWWLGRDVDGSESPPPPATIRQRMLGETVPGGDICDRMGLGWMVDNLDGALVFHHGGSWGGFQTLHLFVPDADVALVVLANSQGGIQLGRRIRSFVLEHFAGLREPLPMPAEIDGAVLASYAGSYRQPSAGEQAPCVMLRVVEDGITLSEPPDGRDGRPAQFAATAVGDDTLLLADGPLAGLRVQLLRSCDGRPWAVRFGARIWLRELEETA